jgi:hypothetical protein
MSGGHWDYLSYKIEERQGEHPGDVWRLLATIEHELDWGICCDTCYDCAKILTIDALEAYFDTGANSVENSIRILRSSEPQCEKCKARRAQRDGTQEPEPRATATVDVLYEGRRYRGKVVEVTE